MRRIAAVTIHAHGGDNAMVVRRKREPSRRRNYVALGSSSSTSSLSLSLFSFFMSSKKKHWSWMFVIVLIAFQTSLCLAKEDDKMRRSTSAPTFAPTPRPTPLPTSLPTTRPTPAPRRDEKNNDKNSNNNAKDAFPDEPDVEETAPPVVVPVAPPAAVPEAPPIAFIVATSPPTLAPAPKLTMAPIIPVTLTSSPTTTAPTTPPSGAPFPATSRPTWWRRPTAEPKNPSEVARPTADPAQTLDNSGSEGSSGGEVDGTPSLFFESRTIAIPLITVVFEFMPQVVVALEVSPATGTAVGSYDGRRHLNDKKQRFEVAMERELISFLTMILQTNTAQGDSLTSADLSVTISYEDDDNNTNNSPSAGAAFVSGTALFTGQIAELPTEASLHENLVLYFQFWGAGNLHKHLVDHNIDVARVMVMIDGLPVGSSDDANDLPGNNGQQAGETGGEKNPSDSSTPNGHDDNDNYWYNINKASLYAGLSMGFMLMFVITVTLLFLRHRKGSTPQLERDQTSAASFTAKVDRTPERIGSPQMTLSNSSQEHNNNLHNDPADESLSSSSASGVVVNMTNFHELKHEEWDALAEPAAIMGSPPVSSLGHNESEKDAFDDDVDNDEEEANSQNDSMDGSSLYTGSVVTVQSDIMPPPRGALRGSAFQYDPSRLSSVISSARVYAREMDNATSSGDSSDKSGDRRSF